jgi:MFS family permease
VAPDTTILPSKVTSAQKRTLLAAALGWGLDGFDVMLYSNVQPRVMATLGIVRKDLAGLPNTFMLLASGIGGVLFGFIADRIGRKQALMLSILTYSVCSLGSGLASSLVVLVAFRFLLGLGMGGEWNTGTTLVAETWPTHLRARALSIVQGSWAWGLALAALVAGIVLSWTQNNWHIVFFVGILPALLTLWNRRSVPESEMWKKQKTQHSTVDIEPKSGDPNSEVASPAWKKEPEGQDRLSARFSQIFAPGLCRHTIFLFLMNLFGLFAWWGLFSWMPTYLALPVGNGGRGFHLLNITTLLVVLNLVGMFPGYITFGWVAERLGRKRSLILYTLCAALLIPVYAAARSQWAIMVLGALVAFFGTGFFVGSGLIGSEIFPTAVRARALGFTYNGARALSCIAPYTIGWVGDHKGLDAAFWLCAAGFLLTALMTAQLPETRGKKLE